MTASSKKHSHAHSHAHIAAKQAEQSLASATPDQAALAPGYMLSQWLIEEMDCPTEETLIRKRLAQIEGIEQLDFQLMQRKLGVVHQRALGPSIEAAIKGLGFEPVLVGDSPQSAAGGVGAAAQPAQSAQQGAAKVRQQRNRIIVAVVLALVAELGSWWSGSSLLWLALSLVAILLSGLQVYKKGWVAIKNRNLNINALMSIAVTGALAIGEWPEAAMVMSLFALAEWIEARSLDRARHAVEQLLSITPDTVSLWDDTQQQWVVCATAQVPTDSLIRVRPGERIGLDGVVEQGQSDVNQAPITGESMLVSKSIGATVYAGTINGMGELQVRTQGDAEHSTLARIAQAVQNAQQGQAALERFVDRFARIYTPIVVLLAIAIAVLPPLFGWMTWFAAFYKALVLLVIACPCALVISTPVAVVSGLAVAARHGVLIKGGAYLERLRHMQFLALDKTGTLTTGRPRLTDFAVQGDQQEQAKTLSLVHFLAARSDHPASVAVAQGLVARNDFSPLAEYKQIDFQALAGKGVQAVLEGVQYRLGQLSWVVGAQHGQDNALQWVPAALVEQYEKGLREGASFVFFSANEQLLALFLLQDTVKAGVLQSIQALRNDSIQLAVFSGDAPAAVQHVAQQLGIDSAYGNLLPTEKLELLRQQRTDKVVGMVGDGINDAPALAEADIGFAMGSLGADMAIETADVAIMNDDVGQIHWAYRLSHRLHQVLVQNISAALLIKAVFLVWAVFGQATMWMAVFADVGASLLVVANSLRLLNGRGV